MPAITVDEKARFVSILTFELDSNDAPAMAEKVKAAVEARIPLVAGFIGSVLMLNEKKSQLRIVSIWESGHAWSAAQYDHEIGRVVSDTVEAATSYDIATFETIAVIRSAGRT